MRRNTNKRWAVVSVAFSAAMGLTDTSYAQEPQEQRTGVEIWQNKFNDCAQSRGWKLQYSSSPSRIRSVSTGGYSRYTLPDDPTQQCRSDNSAEMYVHDVPERACFIADFSMMHQGYTIREEDTDVFESCARVADSHIRDKGVKERCRAPLVS